MKATSASSTARPSAPAVPQDGLVITSRGIVEIENGRVVWSENGCEQIGRDVSREVAELRQLSLFN